MFKRMLSCLLLASMILLAALQAGCGIETPLHTVSPGSIVSRDVQESSADPSEDPAPEFLPTPDKPVVLLDCFATEGVTARIAEAGNGRVVIRTMRTMETDDGDWDFDTTIWMVDVTKNRIEYEAESVLQEDLLAVGNGGELIGLDYEANEVRIYDSSFKLQHSVQMTDVLSPLFDRTSQALYCLSGEKLVRIGLDGNCEELAYLPGAVTLQGYDAETGIGFLYDGNLDEDLDGLGEITAWSVPEGKVRYTVDGSSVLSCTPTSAWLSTTVVRSDGAQTVENFVRSIDTETGKTGKSYALPDDGYLSEIGGNGYAVWAEYGFDITDDPTYRMVDLNTGKTASWTVGDTENGESVCETLFVEGGKYLVCVTRDRYEQMKLYLTSPDFLTYTDAMEENAGKPKTEKPVPEEELSEQRAAADVIEEEFSVRVEIGNECGITKNTFSYELVPTDASDRKQRKKLGQALKVLETTLGRYPEGFFKTFRNYRNAGGLRFVLVSDLHNEYGSFVPAGVTMYAEGWHSIALDVDCISESLIHHELWHAVEDRICAADRNAIGEEAWAALNPDGFGYTADYDSYADRTDVKKYILPFAKKDAYFAELYSTVQSNEDRATLIELVLCDDWDPSVYGQPDPLTLIRSSVHLNAKLSMLEGPVLQTFGCVYWEEIAAQYAAAA